MSRVQSEVVSADKVTRLLWAGLLLCVAAFVKMPAVDLNVSQYFFTPGFGFTHRLNPWVVAIYDWTPLIGRGILVALVLFAVTCPWLVRWMRRQGHQRWASECEGRWRKMAAVAVICGVLGPGLVIEGWLKNAVGRPRPVQVVNFGGDQPFKRVLEMGTDPQHHRSFVSSHAAAGYWLISLGLTSGALWRRRWLGIGLVLGSAIGLVRIMQGGHFLSDIIFAFYAVWIPCEMVAALDRHRQRHPKRLPAPSP